MADWRRALHLALGEIRLLNHDTLQNEMTIEDPERLNRPWSIVIRYRRITDMDRMIPVDCFENDRNPVIACISE